MARFQRNFNIDTSQVSTGKSQAFESLASSLQGFSGQARRIGSAFTAQEATRDAGQVEPSTEAPETRSPATVYGRNYNRIVLEGHLAATQNAYNSSLGELAQKHGNDPLTYAESAQAIRGEFVSNVAPELQSAVAVDFDNIANSYLQQIKDKQSKAFAQEAATQVKTAMEGMESSALRYVRQGNDDAAVQQVAMYRLAIEGSELLSPSEKAERIESLERGVIEQAYLAELDALETGDAYRLLDKISGEIPERYSPDEWTTFVKSAQTELNQRAKRESEAKTNLSIDVARQISDLEVAINTDQGDMVEQSKTVNSLFDNGIISDSKRTSLLTKINNRALESTAENSLVQSVMKRLEGDDSIIVDRADIDNVYQKYFAPTIPAEGGNAHKAMFVERMKYVPDSVEAEVVNGLRSNNPELILQSVDLMDRIDHIPGLVEDTFSKHDRAFSDQVKMLMSYLPADKAIEQATKNTDPTDIARIEARQRTINEDNQTKRAERYLSSVKDKFDMKFFGTTVDPINQDKLARDYGQLVESYFTAGMDMKAAGKQAEKDMKRIWSVTTATGNERVMKYPPEMFYGVGDNKFMQDQLKADVEELWRGDFEGYFLISDDQTAREASIGKPTYRVVVEDDKGLNPLVGYRWAPDPAKAIEEQMKANQESMETGRKQEAPDFSDRFLGAP